MAEFDVGKAALSLFEKREKRFVLTAASITYLLLSLVVTAAVAAASWTQLGGLIGWYLEMMEAVIAGGSPSEPPVDVFIALAPILALSGLVGLVLFAAYEAACLRWLVRGESGGGLFGIQFGADTWRVFAIYWIWFLLGLAFAVAIALFYVVLNLISGLHSGLQLLVMFVGALTPLGLFALVIWRAVRWAPAAAVSIAQQRLVFFGAAAVSRGRFWPLLGAFVLVIVGYIIATSLADALLRIPFSYRLAGVWTDLVMGSGDASAVLGVVRDMMVDPVIIAFGFVYVAVTSVLAIIFYVALFSVNATAWRASQAPAEPASP